MNSSFRRGGRNAPSFLNYWPVLVAAIIAFNLLLGARSVVSRLPHSGQEVVRQTNSPRRERIATRAAGNTPAAADADTAASKPPALAGDGTRTAAPPKTGRQCRTEPNAEYYGEEVVKSGKGNWLDSAGACCAACVADSACNVWVWCGERSGCGGGGGWRECWLKRKENLNLLLPDGNRGGGLGWTSGAVATNAERTNASEELEGEAAAEAARLAVLKANTSLPLVFFDVDIKGAPAGRIEMVLFMDTSPRCAENFRQFCTGEAGPAPSNAAEGPGMPRHFKGAPFYRIIDQFIDQSGVNTVSIYKTAKDSQFDDDAGGLKLRHEHKGLLSMANMGPNTNTNHFSIMVAPAPHLDGSYTIFGQVVSGLETVDAVNALSKGKPENTANADDGAVIVDCGQLRRGSIVPKGLPPLAKG